MTTVGALIRAAHAGPSAVVTVVVLGLGLAAGLDGGRLAVLVVAVAAGQVSIGWANDWIDAERGRDVGRADKPAASGQITPAALRTAALVAVAVCAVASVAVGVVAGVVHLVAVAGGWAYDAALKSTPASVVPYAISFGLLPVIVAAAGGGATAGGLEAAGVLGAPWWAVATAACFGAGVHLANALPDLAQDARTGVRGLPQRLGARGSVVGTVALLGAGAAAVLTAPTVGGGWAVAGGVAVGCLLAVVAWAGWRGAAETAYRAAMASGLVVVGVLVAQGGALA